MKMTATSYNNGILIAMGTFALLLMTVMAAPMQTEEEQSENGLVARPDDGDLSVPWDSIDTATLRKLILQLDADDRLGMSGRVSRSWPQAEPRGWGLRTLDGRLARPWRADKRQVRFRQCYFNPISCFRK
ncbi:allatostatin isoform X1 [Epargyreus clarus]|uniref:allatostatin isoform X1 n=1 Tax=Epargyreus clarus TaxID=520877 RepID=UPI003C2FD3E2